MAEAASNTSPLLYLHRIGGLEWLNQIFERVWTVPAVIEELRQGRERGYEVPDPERLQWLSVRAPLHAPSEWLAADLGPGELAVLSLGVEEPSLILLLDDALARRIGEAAGLEVWGTLRIVLEAKARGWTQGVRPLLDRLKEAGLWMSEDIRRRVLALAGEDAPG